MKSKVPVYLVRGSVRSLLFWIMLVGVISTFSGIWPGTFTAQVLQDVPAQTRVFRLQRDVLTGLLNVAPMERTGRLADSHAVLTLPLPDGTQVEFRVEQSPVMDAELAARFPEVKSYRGQSVSEPAMTMRCDLSPRGFYAFILDGSRTINVYPADSNDSGAYASSFGSSIQDEKAQCLVREIHKINPGDGRTFAPEVSVGSTLRTYRIAVAATWEYCNAYGGGTNSGTVASINTWLNGVNAVYERELAVHLNLVNNTNILYTTERSFNAGTDPFTNDNVSTMLNEIRPVLRDQVGQANYDLGHVLGQLGSTGGSGISFIGVVCNDFNFGGLGPIKGGGATLVGGTAGNSTALGVWIHEIGHMFGANHSFNGTLSNCSGSQRNAATAYESGSGETIMGYSGICGTDNIATTRDMRLHAGSYAEITSYLASATGASCGANTSTGNNPPTVSAGPDFTIPKNTPFTLTALGSDPDPVDVANLTYAWDQYDSGSASYPQDGTSASYNDAADSSITSRPIFRPFPATNSPSRTFPSLAYILNNTNDPPDIVNGFQTAEELPRIGRSLNFRVMIRDNRSGGGGVNEDSVLLTVAGNAGPFLVTAPETAVNWAGGTTQTVTWSVNGTNVAPVNCANVKISLSTDGGNTFPFVLAASTPNDGSQSVTVPSGLNSTTARIKVEAVGNIFFDISGVNFTVTPGGGCTFSILPASQNFAASGGSGSVTVTASAGCLWTAVSNSAWVTINSGSSGSGNGTVGYGVAANTGAQRSGTLTIAGQTFTVTQDAFVCQAITVAPASLSNGFVGASYNQTLSASGGTAAYSFTVSAGALPGGLSLSSGGAINGAPTSVSTFNVTIRATDANGCQGTRAYSINISASPTGLMFYPLPRPIRLMDTRPGQGNCDNIGAPISGGGSIATLARTTCEGITIPSTAQAIVGNVTVINQSGLLGYMTIYPDGQPAPLTANMIYGEGGILSNNFTVGLSAGGAFDIFSERTIDAIVDISGYFAPPSAGGLYYHPLSRPVRLLDTRPGEGNCDNVSTPIPAGTSLTTAARITCEGLAIPAAAQAIAGNATVINGSGQVGYLTIYPGSVPVPLAATIIYFPGQILSNAFTSSLNAAGQFNVFGERTVDIVVDVAGYYSSEATDANGTGLLFTPLVRPLRTLDTRPGQGNCDNLGAPIPGGSSIAAPGWLTCEGITIPNTARAVLGNVTIINSTSFYGFLTLYPDGVAQPLTANMIYFPGAVLSNAFVVGVNAGTGQYRIFGERTIDVIVDASGYFAP